MTADWFVWFICNHGELVAGGIISGIMAGLLGIGGGVVLVPLMITLGYTPVESVATSSLAIVITSVSGTVQNWRMGYFNLVKVLGLGLPALITAQAGVYLTRVITSHVLLGLFGLLLLLNIYLVGLKAKLTNTYNPGSGHPEKVSKNHSFYALFFRLLTGSAAGILAGLFGVGGGVIMVPLQMLFLGETIKVSIQTSLAVIIGTAASASIGHAAVGNVLFTEGIILGLGGVLGTQVSTRILPKLPDSIVSHCFRAFLCALAIYMFWQSWRVFFQL